MEGTPVRPAPRLALALAAAFALACAAGLAVHEIWLDESQAWLIAAGAASPADLAARLAYEGHPPLWYALLFVASRVWPSPVAMQAAALLAATGVAFLVAWRSPFPPAQKALLAFGYYPLFEYGVISRGYGLGLACLAAYAALRTAGERRAWLLAIPLALAALTSAYGIILAWALAVGLAVAMLDPADPDRAPGPTWRDRGLAAAILVGATAFALLQMRVPADASFRVTLAPGVDVLRAAWATYVPFWAFVPLPDLAKPSPWNTTPVMGRPVLGQLAYMMGPVTLWIAAAALARRPAALAAFVAGASVLWAFCYVGYAGSLRHHGHYFLLWVLCLWVAEPTGPRAAAWAARAAAALGRVITPGRVPALAVAIVAAIGAATASPVAPWSAALLGLAGVAAAVVALARGGGVAIGLARAWGPGGLALTALLALHVVAGAVLLRRDLAQPFTGAAPIAAAIRAADPAGRLPIVVVDTSDINYLGPPIALALGRPVHYAGVAETREATYLVWDRHRPKRLSPATAEARLALSQQALWRLSRAGLPAPEVLIASEAVVPEFPPGLPAEVLALAPTPVAGDEPAPLALYRVVHDPAAGASCPR